MSSNPYETTIPDPSDLNHKIDRIFTLQQANRWTVANTDAQQRIAKLTRLLEWIYDNKRLIQQALEDDFRKPAPEVDLSEVWTSVTEIKLAIRHLKKWIKPKRVKPTLATITTRSWIRYEPRGVVLIISPWNYPFNLTVEPLTSAIAAGNCVIIKPSEFSLNTSRLLADMVKQLFPENEVAVFEGEKEIAIELLKKPFDHIFFTGSTETGKKIMAAAAKNLSSITLELGGKSPTIVDEACDLYDASKKIIWGKYANSGQTCIAPDYLLVQENVYQPLIEALKEEIKQVYGETELERQRCDDYARIINDPHFDRLTKTMTAAVAAGAQIEIGGTTDAKERYIEPTILSGVLPENPVMQEEIFGPVLPVISYKSLVDALQIINSMEKPLALYIFSKDHSTIEKILSNTSAGGTCINEVVLHFLQMNLPFGGVNYSGIGSTHGFYGFKAFSHERAFLKHHRYSPIRLLYPPYTKFKKKLINLVIRYI